MSKREIKHINGNQADSKKMAKAKQQEFVNVKWEATPTWKVFTSNTESSDYFGKITNEGDE
jgi:fibronectin type 3 domain-containing protein